MKPNLNNIYEYIAFKNAAIDARELEEFINCARISPILYDELHKISDECSGRLIQTASAMVDRIESEEHKTTQ